MSFYVETFRDTWGELRKIVHTVLPGDAPSVTRETKLRDNAAWDWVAQVTLLLEVERVFHVRCSISEIAYLKTLGDVVALIDSKRG